MNFNKLINTVYTEIGIKTTLYKSPVYCLEPIIKLSESQEKQMLDGDGQSDPNEYKQINSSTGLAVNYFKILENTGKIEGLQFEEKVMKPLRSKGGKSANLDVTYKRDGMLYYIESKYLEPYYSYNEQNTKSYFNKNYYDVKTSDKEIWYNLFVEAQKFRYYNFSQICRHLLAIYRKHKNDEELHIVFQSVIWLMTDTFIERIENDKIKDSFLERRFLIEKEAKSCQEVINKFLKQIACDNIKFESLYYNDIIHEIASSSYINEFRKRYFL